MPMSEQDFYTQDTEAAAGAKIKRKLMLLADAIPAARQHDRGNSLPRVWSFPIDNKAAKAIEHAEAATREDDDDDDGDGEEAAAGKIASPMFGSECNPIMALGRSSFDEITTIQELDLAFTAISGSQDNSASAAQQQSRNAGGGGGVLPSIADHIAATVAAELGGRLDEAPPAKGDVGRSVGGDLGSGVDIGYIASVTKTVEEKTKALHKVLNSLTSLAGEMHGMAEMASLIREEMEGSFSRQVSGEGEVGNSYGAMEVMQAMHLALNEVKFLQVTSEKVAEQFADNQGADDAIIEAMTQCDDGALDVEGDITVQGAEDV